jgi:hypothetical protein
MYYVCQISNNLLGVMEEFPTVEEAIDRVYGLLREKEIEISVGVQQEVNSDWSYLSDDRTWSICIGTVGG